MRSFISLEFDEELKDKLINIQSEIRKESLRGTWVSRDNFHLTLKFLGEIEEEMVKDIGKIIEKTSSKFSPIDLKFNELGCFKGERDIRVLWLGTEGDLSALDELYEEIEDGMYDIGFKKENRDFKPHITLGRRVILKKNFYEFKKEVNKYLEYGFTLNKITLMKSEEVMKKRIYTPIKSYNLIKKYHS